MTRGWIGVTGRARGTRTLGCHIQEHELRGEDRSEYGERLFEVLAGRLVTLKLPNCSRRQLYRYMDFYRTYPQIVGTLSPQFRRMVPTRLSKETVGTLSPQSKEPSALFRNDRVLLARSRPPNP